MYMMSAAWASLAIVLSALGAAWTWFAWTRQGLRGLVRGAAVTIMPLALWLTGTLRLVSAVSDWAVSWATGLILSPSVLVGTGLFVTSVLLFVASGRIPRRDRPARVSAVGTPRGVRAPERRGVPAVRDDDIDDMDDIEALLRRRGIS